MSAGCTSKPAKGSVEGVVTLDGKPLEEGLIRFVPTDGATPSADATIFHGKFSATVPPGEKKVTISASKVVGNRKAYDTPDSPTVDIVEELLPRRYNADSNLSLTVTSGVQSAEFKLTSQ
jgi:hypothetical protein